MHELTSVYKLTFVHRLTSIHRLMLVYTRTPVHPTIIFIVNMIMIIISQGLRPEPATEPYLVTRSPVDSWTRGPVGLFTRRPVDPLTG